MAALFAFVAPALARFSRTGGTPNSPAARAQTAGSPRRRMKIRAKASILSASSSLDLVPVCPPGVWGQSRWVSLFGAAKEIVRPNGEPPSKTKASRSALVSARSEGPTHRAAPRFVPEPTHRAWPRFVPEPTHQTAPRFVPTHSGARDR